MVILKRIKRQKIGKFHRFAAYLAILTNRMIKNRMSSMSWVVGRGWKSWVVGVGVGKSRGYQKNVPCPPPKKQKKTNKNNLKNN